MTTMAGFADMITQLFEQLGGTGGRQVVEMTGSRATTMRRSISRSWKS
jgi:hypothetical protein